MKPGTYIRLRREARGITVEDVAGMVGVLPTAVERWEDNADVPRGDCQNKLAEAIGFDSGVLRTLINGGLVRLCRVCGCSDFDACVDDAANGSPCHWAGRDICSAHLIEHAAAVDAGHGDGAEP